MYMLSFNIHELKKEYCMDITCRSKDIDSWILIEFEHQFDRYAGDLYVIFYEGAFVLQIYFMEGLCQPCHF